MLGQLWLDTQLRSPGIFHLVRIPLFSYSCTFFFVLPWLCYSCVFQYGFVVAIYQLLDNGHAAIAEFQGVPVKYFPQFVVRRKRSINEATERSSGAGFDVLLYGGLNHITFVRRFHFFVGGPCGGGLNSSMCMYPLFLNASWCGGAAYQTRGWVQFW